MEKKEEILTIDTAGLQKMLSVGRKSAIKIGTAANAKILSGKRVLWHLPKIREYLDKVSGGNNDEMAEKKN